MAKGRLEEPEVIMARLEEQFSAGKTLRGKRILITAGPTREKIDPVRFMTNFSSGKMGYAIAEGCCKSWSGCHTCFGTNSINTAYKRYNDTSGIGTRYVGGRIATLFRNGCCHKNKFAVADYRPKFVHNHKMKKQDGDAVIELERTTDILKTLGERKEHQLLVGFLR
ncbi:phosphopantothenoylcysteine decarboxylase domain-containing protein [Bacillus cytotoxicus]